MRRDLEDKAEGRSQDIPVANLLEEITKLLEKIQKDLLERAREERASCIDVAYNWEDFITALNNKKMVLAPWCDEVVSFAPFDGNFLYYNLKDSSPCCGSSYKDAAQDLSKAV